MAISWLFGVILISLILSYLKYLFTYWQRMGFPTLRPVIPFGCIGPVLRKKQGMGELVRDLHLQSKEPILGIYLFFRPSLIIRDPVLLKRIFTTDFESFTDRGLHYDEVNDPIGAHLFSMPSQAWKELRSKLSPTFSPGKLKIMFQAISEKADLFKEHLDQLVVVDGGQDVYMKTLAVKFNMNVIASVFFGFDVDVFEDPTHPFAKIGDLFMDPNIVRNNIVMFLFFLCPSLLKKLKMPFLSPEVAKYVLQLFNSVLEARQKDPSVSRNDFIQTVIELMEEDKRESEAKGSKPKLSVAKCAAQAFIFYVGGYETTASTTSFCLWELCRNPEWMQKARDEIDQVMDEANGKLQYEDMAKLKVLDQCIKESLRKYPVLPFLSRECTKEYPVPESDLVIPKGTSIFISSFGLMMNPENFPEPEKFDPSRFEGEAAGDGLPYYPFGAGPRICIGKRLGNNMVRMALCTILYHFDLEAVDEKLEFLESGFVLTDKHNIHLKMTRRKIKSQ